MDHSIDHLIREHISTTAVCDLEPAPGSQTLTLRLRISQSRVEQGYGEAGRGVQRLRSRRVSLPKQQQRQRQHWPAFATGERRPGLRCCPGESLAPLYVHQALCAYSRWREGARAGAAGVV